MCASVSGWGEKEEEHLRYGDLCDLKLRGSTGALEEVGYVREMMEEGSRSVLSSKYVMGTTFKKLK